MNARRVSKPGMARVAPRDSLPLRHPAMAFVLAVVAAGVVLSVSYLPNETDFWQHLLVGRAIWETHSIPHTQLWTWPTFGTPDVLPSWLFRAVIWPVWKLGGVTGLFVWRWLTALLAFGLLWAAGRRMGARGLAPLVVVGLCALGYRARSQVRPETLVAVLMALELWVLETRRTRGPDHSMWLIPIACVWANAHISYYLGLIVACAYWLEDWRAARSDPSGARRPSALARVVLGMAVASFVNPFGWRALWQPFDFALHLRNEVIFRDIQELHPVDWRSNWRNGLPLLVAGWPLLLLRRARRRGLDLAEAVLCGFFTVVGLRVHRFIGFYALVAVPFVMRDLGDWVDARRWPRWSARPGARAILAGVICVAIGIPEWSRPDLPIRVALPMERYPVRACDFIAAHDIRGRAFNPFYFGGYVLERFWPDRGRLPFMDIHQAGTPELRLQYMRAFYRPIGWADLERRYRFDWVLLDRVQLGADHLLDFVEADSSFSLVFLDDAAALYVRRLGPLAALAGRFGYRVLRASAAGGRDVLDASLADSLIRRRLAAELAREAEGSPWNATATDARVRLALFEGRRADARAGLFHLLEIAPGAAGTHERLGLIALAEGRSIEALHEFERERATSGERVVTLLGLGKSCQGLGELGRARDWYRRALARDPGNQEARDSLAALADAPGGRP